MKRSQLLPLLLSLLLLSCTTQPKTAFSAALATCKTDLAPEPLIQKFVAPGHTLDEVLTAICSVPIINQDFQTPTTK